MNTRQISRAACCTLALTLLTTNACGGSGGGLPANTHAFLENYANMAHAGYADSHARLVDLGAATDALVGTPTETVLTSARNAWLDARDPYLQTEAFRFAGGPIDDLEDVINAWPLNEAHLDYVVGAANSGLINDPSFAITGANLEGDNLAPSGGESDVTVGYHAIEFLLWGQDESTTGPGARPASDYDTSGAGTAANQGRRGLVLTTATSLLTDHLAALESTWATGGEYRGVFTGSLAPAQALRGVVFGLVAFSGGELGGERLVALDTHDQEDEHSCFSDNTQRDFLMDAIGIENVYLGRYVRTDGTVISGTGLYDVIAAVDLTLANALRDRIATSVALALAVRSPYDQEIAAGNTAGIARVAALRSSLQQQRLLFIDAASALALPDPTGP